MPHGKLAGHVLLVGAHQIVLDTILSQKITSPERKGEYGYSFRKAPMTERIPDFCFLCFRDTAHHLLPEQQVHFIIAWKCLNASVPFIILLWGGFLVICINALHDWSKIVAPLSLGLPMSRNFLSTVWPAFEDKTHEVRPQNVLMRHGWALSKRHNSHSTWMGRKH